MFYKQKSHGTELLLRRKPAELWPVELPAAQCLAIAHLRCGLLRSEVSNAFEVQTLVLDKTLLEQMPQPHVTLI